MANQFLGITDENGVNHFLSWNYVVDVKKAPGASGGRVYVANLGAEAPRGVIDLSEFEYEKLIQWLASK